LNPGMSRLSPAFFTVVRTISRRTFRYRSLYYVALIGTTLFTVGFWLYVWLAVLPIVTEADLEYLPILLAAGIMLLFALDLFSVTNGISRAAFIEPRHYRLFPLPPGKLVLMNLSSLVTDVRVAVGFASVVTWSLFFSFSKMYAEAVFMGVAFALFYLIGTVWFAFVLWEYGDVLARHRHRLASFVIGLFFLYYAVILLELFELFLHLPMITNLALILFGLLFDEANLIVRHLLALCVWFSVGLVLLLAVHRRASQ
jgi:hypothetical protein